MTLKNLRNLACAVAIALPALAATIDTQSFDELIRKDDTGAIKQMIATGADVNQKDARGGTPLLRAAEIGSFEAVKLLVEAGADVNAANVQGATPLMRAIADPQKVRLLVSRGADVSARTKQGRTALIIASANAGSLATVDLLLAKGADAKATGQDGHTTLYGAALANDLAMMRRFADLGVDVNAGGADGVTPLMWAASYSNVAAIKMLIAKGANVNAANTFGGRVKYGDIALVRLTPLMLAAPYGSPEAVRVLLAAGAQVNARDIRGMTPLQLAVASDMPNPETVRLLLKHGADVRAKSAGGETALDWASRFSHPEVMRLLQEAGAPRGTGMTASQPAGAMASMPETRAAIAGSVALLQQTTAEFFQKSACVSCHNQNMTSMAVAAARRGGIAVDEKAEDEVRKAYRFGWGMFREGLLERIDAPGGSDHVTYSLMAMAESNYPSDEVTDALVLNLAMSQQPNGGWAMFSIPRAPVEQSNIARTAMAARALSIYAPAGVKAAMEVRVMRAREYLLNARPVTTDDCAMRLLGLSWTGANREKVRAAGQALLALQRRDGGWAATPHMSSDPYATAEALFALRQAGISSGADPALQAGAAFLLRTRRPDGSWYMASRAPKFQPYFDGGFPYGHDQWISATTTAWAVMALSETLDSPTLAANRQQE